MKKIVYVDMDGVLVDYKRNKDGSKPDTFINFKPVAGAVSAFAKLCKKYDVYILSTAPWSTPQAWMDKRLWVDKYLGKDAYKRLILTHHKNLCQGDYLIDDRTANGVDKFNGTVLQFGSDKYSDWDSILQKLL